MLDTGKGEIRACFPTSLVWMKPKLRNQNYKYRLLRELSGKIIRVACWVFLLLLLFGLVLLCGLLVFFFLLLGVQC